jgi:hypothetical protein
LGDPGLSLTVFRGRAAATFSTHLQQTLKIDIPKATGPPEPLKLVSVKRGKAKGKQRPCGKLLGPQIMFEVVVRGWWKNFASIKSR